MEASARRHASALAFFAGVAVTLTAVFLAQSLAGERRGVPARIRRKVPDKAPDPAPVSMLRQQLYASEESRVSRLNRGRKSWKEATNDFSALTPEEKARTLGHSFGSAPKDARVPRPLSSFRAPLGAGLAARRPPASLDLRDKGVLTPVKNQGYCGSCWAFAAAQQIESYWALEHGREWLAVLAPQQIVSCASVLGAQPWSWWAPVNGSGCFGGLVESAYEYVATFGSLLPEGAFPYESGLPWRFPEGIQGSVQNGICRGPFAKYPGPGASDLAIAGPAAAMHEWALTALSSGAAISGYVRVQTNSAEAAMAALHEHGPLAVVVDASGWHSYDSGVFDGCNASDLRLNHAVQLVGYGRDHALDLDYWLVRNTWGILWGESGYIRLRRGGDEAECTRCADLRPWFSEEEGGSCADICGTCGLLLSPTYPVVAKLPVPSYEPDDAMRRR